MNAKEFSDQFDCYTMWRTISHSQKGKEGAACRNV